MSTSAACPCVKNHSPKPAYLQHHHILPLSWGGKTTASNLVGICGTTHDAVHDLLNEIVRAGPNGRVDRGAYPFYARHLAQAAMDAWREAHGDEWPHVLTSPHPAQ